MPVLIPAVLSLVALGVVFLGFALARRMPSPGFFRLGSVLAATGLTLLWLLPLWLFSADRGDWAIPMFVGAMFVAISLLGGGLQVMRYASGASGETPGNRALEDFIGHNDLP